MKKIEEATRDPLTHSAHWRRVPQFHQHGNHPFNWASRLISNLASMVAGIEDMAGMQDEDRMEDGFDEDDDIEVDKTSYAVDGLGDRIYPTGTKGANTVDGLNGRGAVLKRNSSKSSDKSPSKSSSSRSSSRDKSFASSSQSQPRLSMRGSSSRSKSSSNNDNGIISSVSAGEGENGNENHHHLIDHDHDNEISSSDLTIKVDDSDDFSIGDGGDSSTMTTTRVLDVVIEEDQGGKKVRDGDEGRQESDAVPTDGTGGDGGANVENGSFKVCVATENSISKGNKQKLLDEQDKDLRILNLEKELRALKEQLKVKDA